MIGRTRFGRGLQAIAQDADGRPRRRRPARPVRRRSRSALVGALAVVIADRRRPERAVLGRRPASLLGVKGLVAALVVGFRSPMWAFAAGLALGVVEAAIASGEISGHGIGPSYREVLPDRWSRCSCWPLRGRVRGAGARMTARSDGPGPRCADAAARGAGGLAGRPVALRRSVRASPRGCPGSRSGWVARRRAGRVALPRARRDRPRARRRARRAAVARPGRVHDDRRVDHGGAGRARRLARRWRRSRSRCSPRSSAALVTGLAVVRLAALFLAVSTWILAWLVASARRRVPVALRRLAGLRRRLEPEHDRRTTSSRSC